LKIGKALGIGTGTVQRVLMEQPRAAMSGLAFARRIGPHDCQINFPVGQT
jgi:hypothetical protein